MSYNRHIDLLQMKRILATSKFIDLPVDLTDDILVLTPNTSAAARLNVPHRSLRSVAEAILNRENIGIATPLRSLHALKAVAGELVRLNGSDGRSNFRLRGSGHNRESGIEPGQGQEGQQFKPPHQKKALPTSRLRHERHRHAVHAIALARRLGAVWEHVAEMGFARGAMHFGATHEE